MSGGACLEHFGDFSSLSLTFCFCFRCVSFKSCARAIHQLHMQWKNNYYLASHLQFVPTHRHKTIQRHHHRHHCIVEALYGPRSSCSDVVACLTIIIMCNNIKSEHQMARDPKMKWCKNVFMADNGCRSTSLSLFFFPYFMDVFACTFFICLLVFLYASMVVAVSCPGTNFWREREWEVRGRESERGVRGREYFGMHGSDNITAPRISFVCARFLFIYHYLPLLGQPIEMKRNIIIPHSTLSLAVTPTHTHAHTSQVFQERKWNNSEQPSSTRVYRFTCVFCVCNV